MQARRAMTTRYSYRHLYYFWVVAQEGGIVRGAERLGMAVQTVSAQVRELERALGHTLLKPAGRGLVLTEAGKAAAQQAEQIFQLGEQLPTLVREAAGTPTLRLAVGISDGLPKLLVWRLLQPLLAEPHLRLACHEGRLDRLVGELALNRLDVVLSDHVAPPNPVLKLSTHELGASAFAWYAPPAWWAAAKKGFPNSLSEVPVLLPTAHAAVRPQLDHWFERHGIAPRVAGEFDDSALLKTFGGGGLGVFAAAEAVQADLMARYGVKRVGACDGVVETLFAIGKERKLLHPLVAKLVPQAR
jgi:LysR family transcriptional regulator, transcriptional activator of nhaA